MSTSPFDEEEESILSAPQIIDKTTQHPLADMLLGQVIGAHWMGSDLVLHYIDGHKVRFEADGDILIRDYELSQC
jgi:hypothetical protein